MLFISVADIHTFNLDMTVIFSIASCKSTWETFFHARKERLLLLAITDPDCPRLPLHEALTVSNSTKKNREFVHFSFQLISDSPYQSRSGIATDHVGYSNLKICELENGNNFI